MSFKNTHFRNCQRKIKKVYSTENKQQSYFPCDGKLSYHHERSGCSSSKWLHSNGIETVCAITSLYFAPYRLTKNSAVLFLLRPENCARTDKRPSISKPSRQQCPAIGLSKRPTRIWNLPIRCWTWMIAQMHYFLLLFESGTLLFKRTEKPFDFPSEAETQVPTVH